MKRTIQINLAGTIFNIDDDAYEILRDYLNAVERQFMSSVEGREVISDLEMRMSTICIRPIFIQRTIVKTGSCPI